MGKRASIRHASRRNVKPRTEGCMSTLLVFVEARPVHSQRQHIVVCSATTVRRDNIVVREVMVAVLVRVVSQILSQQPRQPLEP